MHAALIEAVPGLAIAIVIEELEVAGDAIIDRVVFARNRVHTIDVDFLQHLARLAEFLGFRQVAHVAGVHDEGRRLRQRVDVGDRVAEAGDDVGIGFLAKADVRIADLHERQRIRRGPCGRAVARRAERARHAAGDRPDDSGAGPGGKTAQRLTAGGIVAGSGAVVGAHVRFLVVKAGLPVPVCTDTSEDLFLIRRMASKSTPGSGTHLPLLAQHRGNISICTQVLHCAIPFFRKEQWVAAVSFR